VTPSVTTPGDTNPSDTTAERVDPVYVINAEEHQVVANPHIKPNDWL